MCMGNAERKKGDSGDRQARDWADMMASVKVIADCTKEIRMTGRRIARLIRTRASSRGAAGSCGGILTKTFA